MITLRGMAEHRLAVYIQLAMLEYQKRTGEKGKGIGRFVKERKNNDNVSNGSRLNPNQISE